MRLINQNKDYWELDYSWSKRGGKWTEFTDVMLIGETTHDQHCINTLREWVALQETDQAAIDRVKRTIFYAGGIQGYLDFSSNEAADSQVIYLHSRGQDAFDSLSYYSKQIANFLRNHGCRAGLMWREARHDRKDHQLQWPL